MVLLFLVASLGVMAQESRTLYVFEGSDWCTNCMRLEKEVLSDSGFQQFLERKHIVLHRVDFPQRKKLAPMQVATNDSLANVLKFEGNFPTLFLMQDQKATPIFYQNQKADALKATLQKLLR